MKKALFTTLVLVFSLSEPALANVPPAPQSGIALITILPVMIILTLVGAGTNCCADTIGN